MLEYTPHVHPSPSPPPPPNRTIYMKPSRIRTLLDRCKYLQPLNCAGKRRWAWNLETKDKKTIPADVNFATEMLECLTVVNSSFSGPERSGEDLLFFLSRPDFSWVPSFPFSFSSFCPVPWPLSPQSSCWDGHWVAAGSRSQFPSPSLGVVGGTSAQRWFSTSRCLCWSPTGSPS